MAIEWDDRRRIFHLTNEWLSYVIGVTDNGALSLLHVGAPLRAGRDYAHLAPRPFAGFSNRLGQAVPLEVPTPGGGDYRAPALLVDLADGSTVLELAYRGHRILPGKPALDGLPSTYVEDPGEATTLEITLADEAIGLEVALRYSVFRDVAAVARSMRVRNAGHVAVTVRAAMSATLDLPDARWDLLTLSGSWSREQHVIRRPLVPGRQSVSSAHGSSGHQHNPLAVLLRPDAAEEQGEALAVSLVYSGNFLVEAESDQFATTRLRIGINPETFAWRLEPTAELALPEAVIAYSSSGLQGISDAYHQLYRERLARGPWRDQARPVLLNSWEGAYFEFDERRLVEMAAASVALGVELFVLDDGWFGERHDDTSSLGDWSVDRARLPDGLAGLAQKVRGLGLSFGLWIEPEMVSRRSRLFAEHPDWAIGVPGRERTEGRNQYVLDMSRPEVVEHLEGVLTALLASAPISYVKWDMNRTITEPYSAGLPPERQAEQMHRYILGVYELYRRLTEAHPEILFESCAGGGGRFDPGLLAYAPQAWASDDTDAVERLRIQWGTSIAYPLSSIGAHVSAVPNHQVGRVTPLETRAAVAFFGVLGYELDPTTLGADERRDIVEQIRFYSEHRSLFQRGRFLRLRSPFDGDGNECAWMVVSEDRLHAVTAHYRVLNRPHPGPDRLRLRGLDPGRDYRVRLWPKRSDALQAANEHVRGGDELMSVGLFLDSEDPWASRGRGDFQATVFDLEVEGDAPAARAKARRA